MIATRGMHRRDDHETSIMAADRILSKVSELQQRILRALRRHKFATGHGLTDRELEQLDEFADCGYSSVRKRRGELFKLGLVRWTGVIRNGCKEWEAVPATELADSEGRLF